MANRFDEDPDYRDAETLNDVEKLLQGNIKECQRLARVLGRQDMVQFGEAYERLLRLKLNFGHEEKKNEITH